MSEIDESKVEDTTGKSGEEESEEDFQNEYEYQWFAVNTYTKKEKTVADSIESRAKALGFSNLIKRTVTGVYEEPKKDKDGKVKRSKDGTVIYETKNYFPGYVYVEMKMTDEVWYMVRNTPYVTGLVGSSGKGTKPFPIPRDEMEPILRRLLITTNEEPATFKVGDVVKITEGALMDCTGTVTDLNKENCTVTVKYTFFGRDNIGVFSFNEVAKIG